ncbi:MAG: envelope biogenesis factor ElyC [Enterobacteriaceae bacterium]|jgi:hypothetical protein|nr:envelope biogenesis factor ElyC [Enterobacteriaceae bacterium]
MPITAQTLYRDSLNFFKHQLLNIVMLSVLAALLTTLLRHFLMPDGEQLKLLSDIQNIFRETGSEGIKNFSENLTLEQQSMLLGAARTTFGILLVEILGKSLLTASVLILISAISSGHQVNALQAGKLAFAQLPKMLLLIFIYTLLVQLGYALMVIPGVLFSFAFAFAPIILLTNRLGIVASMRASWKLAFDNFRLLIVAILLWHAIELILALSLPKLPYIALTTLNNLLSSMLLIYLFRLYMLTRPQNQ